LLVTVEDLHHKDGLECCFKKACISDSSIIKVYVNLFNYQKD